VSDLHDALKKLAQRGAPRGFDDVLAGAAAESAERTTDARDDLDPIPFVTTEPAEHATRRRRPMGSMIAAAGVATLVLVGAFAVSAVVGGGGANSAEGAVRRLADAISHEDPIAAADILAPDEVRSLPDTVTAIERKAKELELVQTAGAPLAGVDFDIEGLHLSTQTLGDGYAKVTVDTGTFTASTHKAQFSALMQKALHGSKDNTARSDLATLAATHRLPTFVVVVRRGGHWYVSASYTVLEYVREWNELPEADFGSGERTVSTLGADSPDAAVQESMHALQREDWAKLMSMVRPDEIPFYDYRAALTQLIRRSRAGDGSTSNFTIDKMTTTASTEGDTAKVSLHASGRTDSGRWWIDGGCFRPIGDATSFSTSGASGDSSSTVDTRSTCDMSDPYYFSVLALPFGGLDANSQITVVKQDGRWFVSPVGTVLDLLDRAVAKLDRRSVYLTLGIAEQLPADGTLTLGQPVVLTPTNRGPRVLTFEGRQGESLLGLATAKPASPEYGTSALVRMFAPDGSELDGGGGVLFGEPLTLPADGTYKVVVLEEYYAVGADVRVTFWDAADAPPAARQQSRQGVDGNRTCTYTINGSSCVSKAPRVSTGTTVFAGSSPPLTATPAPTISVNPVPPPEATATSSPPRG